MPCARLSLLLPLTVLLLAAQTGGLIPPDLRDYRAAVAIPSPSARLAALTKWLADYPASPGASNTRREILRTHAAMQPPNDRRLRKAAELLIAGAPPDARDPVRVLAAEQYAAQGLLLKDCAQWAEAAARTDLVLQRAEALAALGFVRKQQREFSAAETALRAGIDLNPELARAYVTLGQVKLAQRQFRQAFQLLGESLLEGHLPPAAQSDLEAAWNGLGEPGPIEAELDRRYRERYPNPIEPEVYAPTAARTARVVLVEAVSGVSCLPCAAADLALEAALERFSRSEVALAVYHVHVPVTDPLTAPGNDRRHAGFHSAGVPLWAVDGAVHRAAGGLRQHAPRVWEQLRGQIERRLESKSEATIGLSLRPGPLGVEAQVAFSAAASGHLLRLLLVERMQRYSGRNGIRFHPMVVRATAELRLDSSSGTHTERFDVAAIQGAIDAALTSRPPQDHAESPRIALEQLAVVAYIQNDARDVLQSAYAELPR
jgi:tetratricopeptide (TPR) repeat protein